VRRQLYLLTCLSFSFGCAAWSPKPYVKPPATATLEERQKIYDTHCVTFDPWLGYEVGGKTPLFRSWGIYEGYARYYAKSGDEASAATVRLAKPNETYALASGLLGVAGSAALFAANGFNLMTAWPWVTLGAGYSGEIFFLKRGERQQGRAAALSFDRYLAQDLGLPALPTDLRYRGAPLYLSGTPVSAHYGYFGIGLASISDYDVQDYFTIPGGNNHWTSPSYVAEQFCTGAGTVLPDGATLELRNSFVARGPLGRWFKDSGGNNIPNKTLDSSSLDLQLIPGYTWILHQGPHGEQFQVFLGCGVGLGNLQARGVQGNPAGQTLGTYELEGWGFSGGPILRLQVPAIPFARFMDTGIEIGYRVEQFNSLQVTASDGSYAGRSSPDLTLRGTPSALDFSGPFVNLTYEYGRIRFSK
jgi:hypothetical protein